jgi:hypothetical protein
MKELIFNIQDIFNNTTQDGCLSQYECTSYHIPAYQRGYKWSSESDGAVSILFNDLWEAFHSYQNQERKEYYLQYITVKKNNVSVNSHFDTCLEVIDGQQRLTTLSILLSVISARLQIDNISKNKLHYAIRENFFDKHIYSREALLDLVDRTWEELEQADEFNKQDVFYLFQAIQKSFSFLDKVLMEELDSFSDYLLNHVKIIVNSVEAHIESETVFKNLNSNKVPLTEAELIKGLLITKLGRDNNSKGQKHFKEILEIRMNLGRYWDEMNRWANQPEINSFYFNRKTDGMHQLLLLTALLLEDENNRLNKNTKTNNLNLFNFFHKFNSTTKIFEKLKEVQATLNNWFQKADLYNLIGYCRFVKGSNNNTLEFLKNCLEFSSSKKLKTNLLIQKEEIYSKVNVSDLRFGDHDHEIHAVLLHLNVFPEGISSRFDFYNFIAQKWSLEHIFPQSPEGKKAILSSEQKQEVYNIIGDSITDEVKGVLAKEERDEYEKQIYYKALQNLSSLNSIGNMCLLTSSDNSSNGCGFFNEKRTNILKRIQKGSFVPRHTFDVFSKMIPGLDVSYSKLWTQHDIKMHTQYIESLLN